MAIGRVSITQKNTGSGGITAVERKSFWIGLADESMEAEQMDKIHAIGADTDLDALLGTGNSSLKANLQAAILNAGPNFTAYVFPLANPLSAFTWDQVIDISMDMSEDLDVEIVAITDPIDESEDVDLYQAAADAVLASHSKMLSLHVATPGIASDQSWSEYLAATKAFANGKVGRRVYLVPQIHGTNLGVVIGRLCSTETSIADSPKRVASGAVSGLGPSPKDKFNQELTQAHLTDLADNRFSVPQTYPGFPGWYWADHISMDAPGSDYQLYENLRVIDYLSRRIRVLMIQNIANRALNRTDSSIKFYEGYFMKPIIEAANLGLVKTPKDGDVELSWPTNKKVQLKFVAAPFESAGEIAASIELDLDRVE